MWNRIDPTWKVIVLKEGMGDILCCLDTIEELLRMGEGVVVASTSPAVFNDYFLKEIENEEKIKVISMDDMGVYINGKFEKFSVYRWMIDNNFGGNIKEAYRKFYIG